MKTTVTKLSRFSIVLFAAFAISASTLLSGCGTKDIDKPLDRTPDVPPSTRGSGGGVPGAADTIKKKKASFTPSRAVFVAEQIVA